MSQVAIRDERTLAIEQKINQQVSSAITVGVGGITFQNAGEVMEFAKMMAVSGSAVPKHLRGQPGACLGIVDDAIRFQMSPYALARKSYFVNDNLAYEAQVISGIINAFAPLKERPDVQYTGEGADRKCIVTFKFKDGSIRDYESPKFKDIHPKNSPLWKSDPDQQQAYYSLRACSRRHCPEVILGIYDVEEIRSIDVTPEQPSVMARLTAQETHQPASPEREGFDAAHVLRETSALSGGAEVEQQTTFLEPSDEVPPSSSDAGSGDISPPVCAAADQSQAQESGVEEAGDMGAREEPDALPASNSLSTEDKAFLIRVFKVMKAAVGPEVNVLRRQALVFTDEIGGKSAAVIAKAKTIREQLEPCCGANPKRGTVEVARYLAGIIGVDAAELVD